MSRKTPAAGDNPWFPGQAKGEIHFERIVVTMKNRLECSVTSCRHNSSNLCDLPSIRVDGPGAKVSSQTCCESFEARGQGASNAVSGSASPECSIECKAQNCTYNDNCKCDAPCVCVGCCCSDASTISGTECCTFQEK